MLKMLLMITSGLSVQNHRIQNNIFYPSYFWEATNSFSSFTTSIVGYYSAFDNNNSTFADEPKIFDSLTGVVSKTSNQSYYSLQSSKYYDLSEDLSGVGIIYTDLNKGKKPKQVEMTSYFPSLYGSFTASPLSITSKVNNVMRTDRLPNSDYLDGSGWDTTGLVGNSAAVLQQNLGFATYLLNTDTDDFTSTPYDTGADIVSPDIEGQLYESEVLTSLNTCSNMVGLGCSSLGMTTHGLLKT